MSKRDELVQNLGPYLDDLAALLDSSRSRFSSLQESAVPESPGLYVIYCEQPYEVFYVGKASKRQKPSVPGRADGLRFRIMRNHLAYEGNDNLVRYLMEEFRLTSRSGVRNFVQSQCSVHWLEVNDPQRLLLLEHLAIAALHPRFNKG